MHGIHEWKIVNKDIQVVEANDWIFDCESIWVYLTLLVCKPHQEECTDINDFLWYLCVSYRSLNSITKSFEFPLSRCIESIEDFGKFRGRVYFISLDVRSGYHQIRVQKHDQEKLVFSRRVEKEKFQSDSVRSRKCIHILHCDDAVLEWWLKYFVQRKNVTLFHLINH